MRIFRFAAPDRPVPAGAGGESDAAAYAARACTARSAHAPGRPERSNDNGRGLVTLSMPSPGPRYQRQAPQKNSWSAAHMPAAAAACRAMRANAVNAVTSDSPGLPTWTPAPRLRSYAGAAPAPRGGVRIAGGVNPARAAPLQDGRQTAAARRKRFIRFSGGQDRTAPAGKSYESCNEGPLPGPPPPAGGRLQVGGFEGAAAAGQRGSKVRRSVRKARLREPGGSAGGARLHPPCTYVRVGICQYMLQCSRDAVRGPPAVC